MYRAIAEYVIGTDPKNVLTSMDKYLTEAPQSHCGNLKDAFLKVPLSTLTKVDKKPDR